MEHRDFGQPMIREQLDLVLSQQRMPHSILLYGEPGHSTLPVGLSIARDLLCQNPENGKACQHCASCHRAEKMIHPDLHFLLPLAGAKSISTTYYPKWREAVTENPWLDMYDWSIAAGDEGKRMDMHVMDVLNTMEQLSLQSFEGGNKVLVVWMAQHLAKEGNRLLKLIEEPPGQTYFIFITNQREQVLTTIRSRCMQLFFPLLPSDQIESVLTDLKLSEPSKAKGIANEAGGDMHQALQLTKQAKSSFHEDVTNWFRAIVSRKGNEIIHWAQTMGVREKEEQRQFCIFAISTLREIIWNGANVTMLKGSAMPPEMIQYLSKQFAAEGWMPVLQDLEIAYEKINRNANTKLLWMDLGIRIKNHLLTARHQLQTI